MFQTKIYICTLYICNSFNYKHKSSIRGNKKIKQISMHNPQKQAPRQHANSLSNIISVIIFYFVRLPSGSTIRWYIKCIQFDVKIMYRYILFIAFVLLRSRYQNITVRGCPSNRTKFNIGYPLYFDICNNSFCPL